MAHPQPQPANPAYQREALECLRCGLASTKLLDPTQVHVLEEKGALEVFCGECRRATFWKRTSVERHIETAALPEGGSPGPGYASSMSGQQASPERAGDTRRHRRLRLEQPIWVRVDDANVRLQEVATTINVSRGGVYFETDKSYEKGMKVKAILNYSARQTNPIEHDCHVVRVDAIRFERRRRVALQFVA